jgi:hypothetical protein
VPDRSRKPGFRSIVVDLDFCLLVPQTVQVRRSCRTFEFLDLSVSSEGWCVQWETDPPR